MSVQIKKYIRRKSITLNYRLGRYNDVVWLVGDGRSGTTWVSDLINWNGKRREMFEPFHPRCVQATSQFHRHQYLRPDDTTNELSAVLRDIFSGRFQHPRVDNENAAVLHHGLLIKDIFANLLIGWVNQNIRSIKKILLIRNPFSVALSKRKTKHWGWADKPQRFLHQTELCQDHLEEFTDLILGVNDDYLQRQLMIWSIIHLVPFRQLNRNDIFILFYENLHMDPDAELLRILKFINNGQSTTIDSQLLDVFHRPSRVYRRDSRRVSRKSLTAGWKDELSRRQIDDGLRVLDRFGLADIYGDGAIPDRDAVARYMERY